MAPKLTTVLKNQLKKTRLQVTYILVLVVQYSKTLPMMTQNKITLMEDRQDRGEGGGQSGLGYWS